MALDVGGLVAVVVFYVLILAIGIWASRKSKKEEEKCVGSKSEVNMIGGRNINVLVGVFTMTATWVGGGYIMGTAEAVYSPSQGLIWALGPLAYLITFLLGKKHEESLSAVSCIASIRRNYTPSTNSGS
ncbi:unnamed protein product [Oncorhynchus mykiss]|uniref:High-affinity choline transporter 1-like n=1 Tax=Oncorhynchus mykiss TaxID=8022 RepID=A0A060YUV2_ONCMY|nr:unnamed protein product [Oncorhynchus mykiss]